MTAAAGPAQKARLAGPWQLWLMAGLALALRLLVWGWHELYPLGGDEQEYLAQALTLLRERRYVELQLMRPPLYTAFLAACIYVFDSLVQRLRLIQAIVSALTVFPAYGLTLALLGSRRAALVAALLVALSYTLAAHATELLTETLFLFGLFCCLWLLVKASGSRRPLTALVAGLALGALVLIRSVALPLLPLGALWLLLGQRAAGERRTHGGRWPLVAALILGAALVVAPWTARNYLTYGAPILVDTTGAENLWLDNDPAGREAVKRQLYAMGEDRAGRQQVALARGAAAILADPARFLGKAWGEARRFFALEYFDDMRDRPSIWVPPAEVWLRLLLGDGLWLLTLLAGVAGLWLARGDDRGSEAPSSRQGAPHASPLAVAGRWRLLVAAPWALYTLLTAMLFHVELRYRLPLYPALVPFAGWALAGRPARSPARFLGAALSCLALIGLTLAHRPYPQEAWALAWKHARLWQAERALGAEDAVGARAAAEAALALDDRSALARVALARAALLEGDERAAHAALDAAEEAIAAHPHAHLLRGALLRAEGRQEEARAELAYETRSLEDLQSWAWRVFAPMSPPPARLDIGAGLDLGFVRGFHAPEAGGFRWTTGEAQVRLAAPTGAGAWRVRLLLASGRPASLPDPEVTVLVGDRLLGRVVVARDPQTYEIELPPDAGPGGALTLTLRSPTFRPRAYDRASGDNRDLGVMVSRVEVVAP